MSRTNNPCENCTKNCPESGCADWKKWFVKNWNENICVKSEPQGREVFQYEHPERVREMTQTSEHMMVPGTMSAAEFVEVYDGQ